DVWSIDHCMIGDATHCFRLAMETMREYPNWGIRVVEYTMPEDGDASEITCKVVAEFAPPIGSPARKKYEEMMAKRKSTALPIGSGSDSAKKISTDSGNSLDRMDEQLQEIVDNAF